MKQKSIHDVRCFRRELDLQLDILYRLHAVEGIIFGSEVQFGNKIVDIVWIDNNEIHAVELKLTNWRGALEQAKDYMMWGANYSYICMPPRMKGVPKTAKDACCDAGIGYLEYVPPDDYDAFRGRCHYNTSFDFSYPFKTIVAPLMIKTVDIKYDERSKLKNTIEWVHFTRLAKARMLVKTNSGKEYPDWMKRPSGIDKIDNIC